MRLCTKGARARVGRTDVTSAAAASMGACYKLPPALSTSTPWQKHDPQSATKPPSPVQPPTTAAKRLMPALPSRLQLERLAVDGNRTDGLGAVVQEDGLPVFVHAALLGAQLRGWKQARVACAWQGAVALRRPAEQPATQPPAFLCSLQTCCKGLLRSARLQWSNTLPGCLTRMPPVMRLAHEAKYLLCVASRLVWSPSSGASVQPSLLAARAGPLAACPPCSYIHSLLTCFSM